MRPLYCELAQVHPPEHEVESWPNALGAIRNSKSTRKALLQDCASAATARAQLAQGDYSHGKTFWVGALDKPKSTLESLALDIFHSHLTRQTTRWSSMKLQDDSQRRWTTDDVDMSISGAEWWTLSMDGEDGGVGWHWDKDYHAELEEGNNVHPFLATVSYFSDIGAPTMIFPKTTAGPIVSAEDYTYSDSPMTYAYLSRPVLGKHIAFDGRLLHSAPTDLYDEIKVHAPNNGASVGKRGPRPKRVTFLVNIWINHKPLDAMKIEDSLQTKMSRLKIRLGVSEDKPVSPLNISVIPIQS